MPSALNIFTSRRRKYAYGVCNSARFGAARRRVLFPVSAYERVTRHAPSFELASKRSHNSFAVHLGTLLALNFISVMPVSAEGPLLQLAGYVIEKSWSFKQSIEIEREKGRARGWRMDAMFRNFDSFLSRRNPAGISRISASQS